MDPGSRGINGQLKALIGGKLIDGTGGTPIEDAVVIIEGDHIFDVGKADIPTVPTGAEVIDVTGKTIIPGLINCHTHFCLDGSPDPATALKQRSFTENVLIAAKHCVYLTRLAPWNRVNWPIWSCLIPTLWPISQPYARCT